MIQPYTKGDLEAGEKIVRELHGLRGYDAWAERIAKALAAERERCVVAVLEQRCERGTPWDRACVTAAEAIRSLPPQEYEGKK